MKSASFAVIFLLFSPLPWKGLTLPAAILPHLPSSTTQHSFPVSLTPSHFPLRECKTQSLALPLLTPSQPNRQVGRHRKRPNTGRGPSPDGTLNAECLKTTTWQSASHRRFQRKSNISFQIGPWCLLRVPALSFFCFLSLFPFFPWVFFAELPPITHVHTSTHTQRALEAVCGAKVK